MRISAIVVAAGSGQRLGHQAPKAFVQLRGHPLLYFVLRSLTQVPDLIETVITLPPGKEEEARRIAASAGLETAVKLTEGGKERQDSVRIALGLTSADSDVVIVHDAARPFAPAALFTQCARSAAENGGAIAAVALADTLKEVAGGIIRATLSRAGLYLAQTPQAFRRDLLRAAHDRAARDAISATDDAGLVERLGASVRIVESSVINLKITTPDDLRVAETLAPALLSD